MNKKEEKLLRQAYRYETSYKDIFVDDRQYAGKQCILTYTDVLTLLQNLKEKDPTPDEMFSEWGQYYAALFGADIYQYEEDIIGIDTAIDSMIACAESLAGTKHQKNYIDYDLMIEDLNAMKRGEQTDLDHIMFWNDREKLISIEDLSIDGYIDILEEDEIPNLKKNIEELIEKDYPDAMDIKAMSCYCEDRLYKSDWKTSEELLLRLMDHPDAMDDEKCGYANMLGYIYYYGRTNNGKPEYKKAAQYFTIGALAGVHESMYKLADLYIDGKGVQRNREIAAQLIVNVFRQAKEDFLYGDYVSKFADACLRMGNLYRDGIGVFPSIEEALYYYVVAEMAIRKRMEVCDYIGDDKVLAGIQKEISKIRETMPEENPVKNWVTAYPILLRAAVEDGRLCDIKVRVLKNGLKLTAVRVPCLDEDSAPSMLLVRPESGYCKLIDKAEQYVYGVKQWMTKEPDVTEFRANYLDMGVVNGERVFDFYRDDELVATLRAEKFMVKLN